MQGFYSKEQMSEMNDKLMEALDPTNDYTHEQFMKEYGGNQMGGVSNPDAMKIEFKFVNKSTNQDPEYQTDGSSGFDLRANLGEDEPIVLKAGERALVKTGLFFEVPPNFEIQVRPRSGLSYKHGITVLNTPGTIDADYRGEIGVILINLGQDDFVVEHGERIAQAVISTVTAKPIINLNRVNSIDENTERGSGGFGSTGQK